MNKEDPLAAARGCCLAFALCAPFWVFLCLIFLWLEHIL